MRYYIGADGGGTKVITVLFDEELNILSVGKFKGGINLNFEPLENVVTHMRGSIAACVGEQYRGIIVDAVYIAMPTDHALYMKMLSEVVNPLRCVGVGEGASCLYSGLLQSEGISALSGTGSDVFYIKDGITQTVGGWGTVLGDQGSGYDVAVHALKAVIKHIDGWGEPTILTERIAAHYGIGAYRELVPLVYRTHDARSRITSVVPVVSHAADDGDAVALRILSEAGREMARQTVALIQQYGVPRDADAVVSGGVWKSNSAMYDAYVATLGAVYPRVTVHRPLFEPLIGPVVAHGVEAGTLEALRERLIGAYAPYAYKEEY